MQHYDLIVLGAGVASSVALAAAGRGLRTALIDPGPAGGTCLNRGCIPTKVMLHSGEVARTARDGARFGINSRVESVDFGVIREHVNSIVSFWRDRLEKLLATTANLDFYRAPAHFAGDRIVECGGQRLVGDRLVIAVGARALRPPIPGLDGINYYTNENVLTMPSVPASLAVIGGGYIGMEFACFFAALGSAVTVIEPQPQLLSGIEPSLRKHFNHSVATQMRVLTATSVAGVAAAGEAKELRCRQADGSELTVAAAEIFLAAGRQVNTDTLACAAGGIALDARGYIVVDEFLQTKQENVWAMGDCAGTPAFRHIGEHQAELLADNLFNNRRHAADYSLVPYAAFTYPEIASVGMSHEQAVAKGYDVVARQLNYTGNARGRAMGVPGFCAAVIDKKSQQLLGFHIIGPHASILIHEVLPVMTRKLPVSAITDAIHIHPALSELVQWTFTLGREL